jgi:ketose-bisphosphate aldolase
MNPSLELLYTAKKGKYAIPAFNYADIWELEAIINAAEQEHSPVIVAAFARVAKAHGTNVCAGMVKGLIKDANIPVIHHLDHSTEVRLCKEAVDSGFDSVMIDGSKFSLEENIRVTKEVCGYAHAKKIYTEGEIGQIMGRGFEGDFEGGDFLVQVPDAIQLVNETCVDTLAIGVGTAHGFYEGTPKINFERIKEVNDALDLPLVLHGGTGIPVEDVQYAISLGISKVNVGTAIWYSHAESLATTFKEKGPIHILDANELAKEKVQGVVIDAIRMCMSVGKA